MARKTPQDDAQIYVCFESFAGDRLAVPRGARLRADHEIVRAHPTYFVPDNTPDDEISRLRSKLYSDAEARPPEDITRVQLQPRLREEDAVVVTGLYFGTVQPGQWLDRRDQIVRDNGDKFVPVLPAEGVDRQDCLLALETLTHQFDPDAEGHARSATVYKGQLVPRDSWFVVVHPELFAFEMPTRSV